MDAAAPKVKLRRSTIIVSAVKDGVVQGSNDIILDHGPEATDGQLIAETIKLIRTNAGILVNAEDGVVDFYPLPSFVWRFKVQRVTLALGNSLAN